jgi:hypothetical protein
MNAGEPSSIMRYLNELGTISSNARATLREQVGPPSKKYRQGSARVIELTQLTHIRVTGGNLQGQRESTIIQC